MEERTIEKKPSIRPAHERDLTSALTLLAKVNLPLDGVAEHLQDFILVEDGGKVIGLGGLEVYGEWALLRSLAIEPARQGRGLGDRIYHALLDLAKQRGITHLCLLTETAAPYFAARGFEMVSRDRVDSSVHASVEFRSACDVSAVCMMRRLT